MLSVSRVTIWRLAKEGLLSPIELLPGTLRYSFNEVAELAARGAGGRSVISARSCSAALGIENETLLHRKMRAGVTCSARRAQG